MADIQDYAYLEEFERQVEALIAGRETYIHDRLDINEMFEGIPVFDKSDKQKAVDFVRQTSARMPAYLKRRRELSDEYLSQREDVPKAMREMVSTSVNIDTDTTWYITLQCALRSAGVGEELVDTLRREYLEMSI